MMKKKIEYIIYQIIIAAICYAGCREHNSLISEFTSPPFRALFWDVPSESFTVFERIAGIALSVGGIILMGVLVTLACSAACLVPLFAFHYEDQETKDAFDKIFRWSIVAAIIVVVYSLVTFTPVGLD